MRLRRWLIGDEPNGRVVIELTRAPADDTDSRRLAGAVAAFVQALHAPALETAEALMGVRKD